MKLNRNDDVMHACRSGDYGKVEKLLVENRFSFGSALLSPLSNSKDRHGNSLLHVACQTGQVELLGLLKSQGIKVDARNARTGASPLHMAVVHNQFNCAEWCLKQIVNPNERDAFDRTPLHWASLLGNVRMVRLLLDYGADPSLTTAMGQTAAELTFSSGVRQLLSDYHKVRRQSVLVTPTPDVTPSSGPEPLLQRAISSPMVLGPAPVSSDAPESSLCETEVPEGELTSTSEQDCFSQDSNVPAQFARTAELTGLS